MVKKDLFVCSCSFGKDSLAMLLRLLESGMPVDIILFNETGLDFPEMEEHIRKVEEYIKKYTDIGITRLKPEHPFEYYFFDVPIHHRKKTKFNERLGTDSHNGFSWPGPKIPFGAMVCANGVLCLFCRVSHILTLTRGNPNEDKSCMGNVQQPYFFYSACP